jgi:hypothetical protein
MNITDVFRGTANAHGVDNLPANRFKITLKVIIRPIWPVANAFACDVRSRTAELVCASFVTKGRREEKLLSHDDFMIRFGMNIARLALRWASVGCPGPRA